MNKNIILILFIMTFAFVGCATQSKNALYNNQEDKVVSPPKRLNSQY